MGMWNLGFCRDRKVQFRLQPAISGISTRTEVPQFLPFSNSGWVVDPLGLHQGLRVENGAVRRCLDSSRTANRWPEHGLGGHLTNNEICAERRGLRKCKAEGLFIGERVGSDRIRVRPACVP